MAQKDKQFISELKKVLGLKQSASEADVFVEIGRLKANNYVTFTPDSNWTCDGTSTNQ